MEYYYGKSPKHPFRKEELRKESAYSTYTSPHPCYDSALSGYGVKAA